MIREPRCVGYSPLLIAALLAIVVAIAAYATPIVNITKPADKEIVSGIADIEVTYTSDSNSPIVRLEVYIDRHLVKDYRLTDPRLQGKQSFRWDFALATPSTHSISARAMDAAGAVGATGIKVVVQRRAQEASSSQGGDRTPPTVDLYYPQEGQVVNGEVRVQADVSDNVGVRTVIFYLDGKFKTMMMNSPNYSDRIDTRRLTDGPHVVTASAWDLEDNEGRSEERTFIVRNREATATASGQPRISRATPPKPPAPPPPTLKPPIISSTEVGHEAAPVSPAPPEPATASKPGVTVPEASPTAAAPEVRPATGDQSIPIQPAASSAALTTEAVGSETEPRTSFPGEAALPPPPSPKASTTPSPTEVRPSTSGLVASLPPHSESRPMAARESATASSPLAGRGRDLAPEAAVDPSAATTTEVVMLTDDRATPAAAPSESVMAPKTGAVSRVKAVVVASPHPRLGYDAEPLGDLRQERVAVLPARKMDEGRPRGKLGQPAALAAEAMAPFRDVKVVFDGELLSLRTAPLVLDGISIAPLREVFEHTDGVLYWFHVEKRVHAVNRDTDLQLKIGDPTVTVNGDQEKLVLAPFIKNGRTMVPLEFVASTLDVTVSFNSDTGELVISSNKF